MRVQSGACLIPTIFFGIPISINAFSPITTSTAWKTRVTLRPIISHPISRKINSLKNEIPPSYQINPPLTSVVSSTEEPLFEGLGKGIKRDMKNRYKLLWSDVTDGINTQCLAAIAFLFFACLAPAIGFGTLFGVATGGQIGTIEMVSSTAASGMIYALFSAQPLTIIGSTGPVLAFVACLHQLSILYSLPFLPLYTWTGLWTAAILFASSITSGSNLVKYLTRFTDEIFSLLISVIFVYEAGLGIVKTFTDPSSTFVKGLLASICALVTYSGATALRKLRSTSYFPKRVRNNIANFAPTIGVIGASLLAKWARAKQGVDAILPALAFPTKFGTTTGRNWLVPLLNLPVWARYASIIPALMATVLLFLDQNITVRLVNNSQYKMKKGRRPNSMIDGMHLDMLCISILTAIQSILGLPWLVAATVRSISHVRALTIVDEKSGAVKETREQRVTGFSIHALIGACVLFSSPRKILTNIPKASLLGLFMFLGISALPGNELWERTKELFKDGTSDGDTKKWSSIPKNVVNSFTLIQLVSLISMFAVKNNKTVGVLFPIIIAMLAPMRFWLVKSGLFKSADVELLDNEDE